MENYGLYLMVVGFVGAILTYVFLIKKTKIEQPTNVLKLVESTSRTEMIDLIVNKTLDSYENVLLTNLQSATDSELRRTVTAIREAEQMMKKSPNA